MTKDQVKEVLPKIVESFQSEETQAKLNEAGSDLGQILTVVMTVQGTVLQEAGINPAEGLAELGKLEETFGDDEEIMQLAADLKKQVQAAKSN